MSQASTFPAELPPKPLNVTISEAGEAESIVLEAGNVIPGKIVRRNAEKIPKGRKPRQNSQASKLFGFCHILGLDSLYFCFSELKGNPAHESQKIIKIESLGSACYASLLHLLPISACLLLTVFNWRGLYIGGELGGPVGQDGLKFLGLQFAAKSLELTSMASLSCILFYIVRRQLLEQDLPFGALTSGFEFSRISLLWSKEFIATCSAEFGSSGRKPFLVAAITLFTLLGASIGPSAAVASQPTLQDWRAGGTSFYINATWDQLFPQVLNAVAPSELSCSEAQANDGSCFPPNYNLFASEILSHWPSSISSVTANHFPPVMPENTLIAGRNSLQRLSNRLKGGFVFNPDLTAATVPMVFIAESLALLAKYWFTANQALCAAGATPSFCYYKDIANYIESTQPLSFVLCNQYAINSTLSFASLDEHSTYPPFKLENDTCGSQEQFDISTHNRSRPNLTWISLPETTFGSIGALVAIPISNTTTDPGHFFTCTIDARWVNSTATATFLGGPMVVTGSFSDYVTSSRFETNSKGQLLWQRINITALWAEHLNPAINKDGTTVFEFLTKSVARVGNIASVPHSSNAVEAILALMLTEGISRIGNSAAILGSLKGLDSNDWRKEILPHGHVFGDPGSAFDFIPVLGDNSTKFVMKATVKGFGYGPSTATVLSIATLMTYSAIAILYVVYSIYTGSTSTAWESISELVALAIKSKSTSTLEDTGAGISTLRTLKQLVWIGIPDGLLQISFEKRPENSEGIKLHQVVENDPYG